MDELTLWEIIEGFEQNGKFLFTLEKDIPGWRAWFGIDPGETFFKTRKEALISAITKLKLEA